MKRKIKKDRENTIIRRSSKVCLGNSTETKLNLLNIIVEEYKRVVNLYIQKYIDVKELPLRITEKIETWLSVRMQRKCGDHALTIIRSTRTNERNHRYAAYKKVYRYFKKKNRQISFLEKRFSELNLIRKYKPFLKKDVMVLDGDIIEYIDDLSNSFDRWIKLTSIGNKIKLVLPFNLHRHYKKYLKEGWKRRSGCRFLKINDNWYLESVFEKAIQIKKHNRGLALDQGITKLLATTENKVYGLELKPMLYNLMNKRHGSKAAKRLVNKIKQYIHSEVKRLPVDYDFYVLEDLSNIQIGTTKRRKKRNKTSRKLTARWQLDTLHTAINNYCDLNGIPIRYINPANTSRTCPQCGYVDEQNRDDEVFECCNCGYIADADINAAYNILERFYQERGIPVTVPDSEKVKSLYRFIDF